LLAVALATGVRIALDPVVGLHSPYLPFVLALIVAARYGGRGPGLAATATSMLVVAYFFLEPLYSFSIAEPWAMVGLALYGVVGVAISLLVGQLRHSHSVIAQSEERLRLFVEHAPAAIALLDRNMCYLKVSRRWLSDFHLPEQDLVGRSHYEVFPKMRERQKEIHKRCLAGAVEKCEEDAVPGADGTIDWIRWEIHPWRDANHEIGGIIIFSERITERKRAEEELRASREELRRLNEELDRRIRERTAQFEASNRELEAFAYSVSHDLRAPLRGIDGWSWALLEDYGERLDAQAHRYIERVRSEAQRMGVLIDDLLKLSRVTRAEMKMLPVDLTALARAIATRVHALYPGRQIEFVIQPGLAAIGDASLLDIALTNLFDNAAKFTANRARAVIEFSRAGQAFSVRDNGVGFDMEHAGRLFGTFQRLHKSAEFPGTGIGLATVQRVVRRHGGEVWAEAEPDRGATFHFTLGGKP